jgi:hypothetical protein
MREFWPSSEGQFTNARVDSAAVSRVERTGMKESTATRLINVSILARVSQEFCFLLVQLELYHCQRSVCRANCHRFDRPPCPPWMISSIGVSSLRLRWVCMEVSAGKFERVEGVGGRSLGESSPGVCVALRLSNIGESYCEVVIGQDANMRRLVNAKRRRLVNAKRRRLDNTKRRSRPL